MGPGDQLDAQKQAMTEAEKSQSEKTPSPMRGEISATPPHTIQVQEIPHQGPPGFWTSPEEQQLVLQWRQQKARNQEEENRKKEADRRAAQHETDRQKLLTLRRQREELAQQERALLDALEKPPESPNRRPKRGRKGEDESSDSESHVPSSKPKPTTAQSSDSEEGKPPVRERLFRVEKALFGSQQVDREPAVIEEIESFRPEAGRQFPKMDEYGGKGDPEEHCDKYESLMSGMGHCNTMLCKMFKTYLTGSASLWYRSLRPRSITSYAQLRKKFLRQYSHLRRREKDTEALIHCRQKPNEELGDYLARFKEEAGMVTNLDKTKAMGFLSAGLDPVKGKKLRSSLYDVHPTSLNDIYQRGEAIRRKMESIGGYRSERKDDHPEPRREGRGNKPKGHGYPKGSPTDHRSRPTEGNNTVFTPLNTPISRILHEIKSKPDFVRPPQMRASDHRKNSNKYCDYHQDKGHNTDECFQLKKLIEKMVKEGQLSHFVGDLREKLDKKGKGKAEGYQGEGTERYRGEVK